MIKLTQNMSEHLFYNSYILLPDGVKILNFNETETLSQTQISNPFKV